MRRAQVTAPELILIAGTRVALGAGLGLLLSGRLPPSQRRAVGWTLSLFGALTTIPLAVEVLSRFLPDARGWGPDMDAYGSQALAAQPVGTTETRVG